MRHGRLLQVGLMLIALAGCQGSNPTPVACASGNAPVCGSDGRNYANRCEADAVDASTAHPGACGDAASPCPAALPFVAATGETAACSAPSSTFCYYGHESCCGQTFPSWMCSCLGARWGCSNTDACYMRPCTDAGMD